MELLGYNIPKDLSTRPDVGQIAARAEVEYNEKLENGKAKALDRKCLQLGYVRSVIMMNVVVTPFKPSLFSHETFMKHMNKCNEWIIKRPSEGDQSAVLLNYNTVGEGDAAREELLDAFADSPDIQVLQPNFPKVLDLFPQHVNTGSEWVLNELHFGIRQIQEPLGKRLILLENVPACSEEELRTEFPEALNIFDFNHDPDAPGMVVVEVMDTDGGTEFIEKYMRHSVKGQRILVDWYTNRDKRQGHLMKKWKEKKAKTGKRPLNDAERLEAVRMFQQIRDARDGLLARRDIGGVEKLRQFSSYKIQLQELQDHLYADAKRRKQYGIHVPEPVCDQIALVQKLMSGKHEEDRARNQRIAQEDLERQAKERELETLKQNLSVEQLCNLSQRFTGMKRQAGASHSLPGVPPAKRSQTGNDVGKANSAARGKVARGRGRAGYPVSSRDPGSVSRGGGHKMGYPVSNRDPGSVSRGGSHKMGGAAEVLTLKEKLRKLQWLLSGSDRGGRGAGRGFARRGGGGADFRGRGGRFMAGAGREDMDFAGAGRGDMDFSGTGRGDMDFAGAGRGDMDFSSTGGENIDFAGTGRGDMDFAGAGRGDMDFSSTGGENMDFAGMGRGDMDFPGTGRGDMDFAGAGRADMDFAGRGRGNRGVRGDVSGGMNRRGRGAEAPPTYSYGAIEERGGGMYDRGETWQDDVSVGGQEMRFTPRPNYDSFDW